MMINQGLGGPKANPKGVADGQPVNIPALLLDNLKMTESSNLGALLDLRLRHKGKPKCCEYLFFRKGRFKRALFQEKF